MRNKRVVLIVLLVLCASLLAGCGVLASPEEDAFIEDFLGSVENGDYEANYNEVVGFGSEEEYVKNMKGLDAYYHGEIVKLKKTGIYVRTQMNNGQTVYSKEIAYQIETTQNNYTMNTVFVSEDGEIYSLYVYNIIESSELAGNGELINFEDFDIVQLLLLVFSALCIGFMIFAIVLCAKSKVRLKGLWIPIIVLIQTGVSISNFPNSSSFNFLFFTTNISSLRKFLDGGYIFTLLVPVGAILFVALRKHLVRKAAEYRAKQAYMLEQPVLQNQQSDELPPEPQQETREQ